MDSTPWHPNARLLVNITRVLYIGAEWQAGQYFLLYIREDSLRFSIRKFMNFISKAVTEKTKANAKESVDKRSMFSPYTRFSQTIILVASSRF